MESSGRDGRRRGSISRFLERVRGAIRRRRRGSGTTASEQLGDAGTVQPELVVASTTVPEQDQPTENIPAPTEAQVQAQSPLAARDGTEDADEPLLPMQSGRSGFSQERANALFKKFGIEGEPLPISTSPENIRRVERPIRIRIHWTCHQCSTQFGASRVCSSCQHRRCSDCTRAPPKKVEEILETARNDQEERLSRSSRQGGAGLSAAVVIEPPTETEPSPPIDDAQPRPLEPRSAEEIAADEALPAHSFLYVLQQRPAAGMDLMLPSEVQSSRRTCHKCQTHIDSADQSQCQSCNHTLCDRCPREVPRRSAWSQVGMSGFTNAQEEPKMVATVQRVYRKPRQRLRWNCHECNTMFIDRTRCRRCGHERCKMCPRTPSKRVVPPPDPAVLQSVADKLAHLDVQPQFSEATTTAAATAA